MGGEKGNGVRIRPLQVLQPAVFVSGESRAAFDPLAAVGVWHFAVRADFGGMDVVADDAVGIAPARFVDERVLVVADVLARILDRVLEMGRQRSVGEPRSAADRVECVFDVQGEIVGTIPGNGEPFGILDDAVALIAVDDEEAPAIGGDMERLLQNPMRPKRCPAKSRSCWPC